MLHCGYPRKAVHQESTFIWPGLWISFGHVLIFQDSQRSVGRVLWVDSLPALSHFLENLPLLLPGEGFLSLQPSVLEAGQGNRMPAVKVQLLHLHSGFLYCYKENRSVEERARSNTAI